ncbi:MAG: archaellin/type IV pilin N-terminal domain-containing protein, partial [Candidatus Micrarchaeia archaeon]
MKNSKKGVSPVIAILLLVAITISLGILTYLWTADIAGTLKSSSQVAQVSEGLTLIIYDAKENLSRVAMTLRNTGASTVNISKVYFDGVLLTMETDGNGVANDGKVDGTSGAGWTKIPPREDRT